MRARSSHDSLRRLISLLIPTLSLAVDFTKALQLDREIGRSAVSSIARDGLLIFGVMLEKNGAYDEAYETYYQATKLP